MNHPSDLDPQVSESGTNPADILAEEQLPVEETTWEADELEEAYLKALEATENIDWGDQAPQFLEETTGDEPTYDSQGEHGEEEYQPVEESTSETETEVGEHRLNPMQIVEATIFVGGEGMTARKISSIFKGNISQEAVEQHIHDLNEIYIVQGRPYEIALQEGGYRLVLKPDFQKYRMRLYGYHPKEVKLPQDALEILAFIAYLQPVTKTQIENLNKSNALTRVRQLIRHQLVFLERVEKEIQYRTTSRFLSLFGLSSLKELPRAADIARK